MSIVIGNPNSSTVLEVITAALITVKALAVGETPGSDMTTDGLTKYNEMLESLSLQNLAVFANTNTVITLVANQAAYVLGPNGTGQRPLSWNAIDSAFTTFDSVDYTVEVVSKSEYDELAVKQITGIPTWAAFENDYPDSTLLLYPIPYQAGTLTVNQRREFTQAGSIYDTFDMPPGYKRMLRLLLAWELASDYPGLSDGEMAKLEKDKISAVAMVKRANMEPVTLESEVAQLDASGGNSYVNWRDGA